jgi:prefoldin subunit 5
MTDTSTTDIDIKAEIARINEQIEQLQNDVSALRAASEPKVAALAGDVSVLAAGDPVAPVAPPPPFVIP